jgi:hypothetical protein
MDDALARHTPMSETLFERLGGHEILAVDGRTDAPQALRSLTEPPIVLLILRR